MWRALLMVIVFWMSLPAGAEPEAPPIPIVKTLAELRGLPSVKLSSGQRVRIGITESAAEGSPWRLVYCLPVDLKAPPVNPDGDPEERLGPVIVRVVRDKAVAEITGSVQARELQQHERESFYCTAVPVFNEGTFHVEVLEKLGKTDEKAPPIFRSTIEVKSGVACHWHRFAERAGEAYAVTAKPTAARPRYSGMVAHEWPGDAKDDLVVHGLDVEHPLELSLDQSVAEPKLIVKCAVDMIDSPNEHMLACWWVNGKPVNATPANVKAAQQLQQNGWRIHFAKEMELVLTLPRTLGPLKAGDKVALRLMYSPAGIKPFFERSGQEQQQMLQIFVPRIIGHPATLPRLSEKLEITVTADMLPK
jgi:hypothetical protein